MIKQTTLFLFDSYAKIEIENNDEGVVLGVHELYVDDEQSTTDNEVLLVNRTAEVYLSEDDIKELIRSLQGILPENNK